MDSICRIIEVGGKQIGGFFMAPTAIRQNWSRTAIEDAGATHASCPQHELRIQDRPQSQGPEAIPGIA
eukprot:4618847-Prorocentrum_lima.AAC.1